MFSRFWKKAASPDTPREVSKQEILESALKLEVLKKQTQLQQQYQLISPQILGADQARERIIGYDRAFVLYAMDCYKRYCQQGGKGINSLSVLFQQVENANWKDSGSVFNSEINSNLMKETVDSLLKAINTLKNVPSPGPKTSPKQ